jgi:hypothetical protein
MAAATTTVRLAAKSRRDLRQMATTTGVPMTVMLERVIECYRRKLFLEQAAAEYAALREDEAAWQDLEAERAEWDATLYDGMEDD